LDVGNTEASSSDEDEPFTPLFDPGVPRIAAQNLRLINNPKNSLTHLPLTIPDSVRHRVWTLTCQLSISLLVEQLELLLKILSQNRCLQ